jgi:hypothetical protein
MSLAEKTLIVRLKASVWSARRFDNSSTAALTADKKASRAAARVNQYLMVGADTELKEVHEVVRAARDYLDNNSVPWDTHGGRLVTPQAWFGMQTEVNKFKAKYTTAVEKFLNNYPANAAIAAKNLGDLFQSGMFPFPSRLPAMFGFEVQLEALPLSAPSDPRYGLSQEEIDILRTNVERTVMDRLDASLEAQWRRLLEEVSRLNAAVAEREEGRRTPIFETTVEKLRNTAQVLKEMNVTDSSHINILCGEVLDALHGVGVDTLRISASQRADVHKATSAVMKKLEGLLL